MTASYAYDPLGRRIKKTVNGVTTWYLWDGAELLAEYDGSGNRTKRYAYLPDSYAPIQAEDVNGTYNVHSDHLDMPKLVSDGTQQIVWRGRQEAFGRTIIDPASTVELNIRFPGQYHDAETGLHYNYFRYYDPAVGRYVTADPIGLGGGVNAYAYAGGNPIRLMDPAGLCLVPHLSHLCEAPMSLMGQIVPRLLGNYYVQAGLVSFAAGYWAGTQGNRAIEKYIFDGRNSVGGWIWDMRHPDFDPSPEPPPKDEAQGSEDPTDLPDFGSPDPVDKDTQKEFCRQNPNAPNCQNECE
ncbi:MAG: hypothetical protein J5I92_00015 [Thiogranum sp.]|nr:hypothetical protein [Thiogranum sp.]